MLVLALETSGSPGSLALGTSGGAGLWREEFPAGPRHGGNLFAALERALSEAGKDLGEIRVGLGPGSYAGVRAALAVATGLALARPGTRLVGLPSVCAYATDAPAWHAVGDARRGAWYHTAVENGRCVEGPEVCTLEQLHARLAARPDWPVLAAEDIPALPQARRTLADAGRLLALPPEPTPRALEPIYLREPYITLPRPRAL